MTRRSTTQPRAAVRPDKEGTPGSRYYRRERYRDRVTQASAQVLVIPGARPQMLVKAAADAIDVDFRHEVVRKDLDGGNYRIRPGYYIPDILSEYRDEHRPVVVLNGNNVGYWGNQFVIEEGKLQYKRKGPIFDSGEQLRAHATGHHAFFVSGGRFRIDRLNVTVAAPKGDDTGLDFDIEHGSCNLPRFGLSGFPLIRDGATVWRDHAPLAWDPGLLYDLGPIPREGYDYIWVRDAIRELLDANAQLVRHPMTVIGVDARGDIVLMVVERSATSPGMTVEEAAVLLVDRYDVRDAIVLGAAGDAQLATTEEGFLVEPFVAPYAEASARRIDHRLVHPTLRGRPLFARPVPSYVVFHLDRPSRRPADPPDWARPISVTQRPAAPVSGLWTRSPAGSSAAR